MIKPKYCTECKWSEPEKNSEWNLRCKNPIVNSKDPWSLAATVIYGGSSCRDERDKYFFAACGIKGKLWEQK
jgi:hypothetical protein